MRLVHAALFFCRGSCRLQKSPMVIWEDGKGRPQPFSKYPSCFFANFISTLCSFCVYQHKMIMMMIIIMTSLGIVSHSYCCSCFDSFNYYNNFFMSIKLAHRIFTFDCFSGYPNSDFYNIIFKTVESWGSLRIRSAFSSTF